MREILFRGKRIDNDEWVEGFYNHIPCGRFWVDEHMIQTVLENGKIGMLHDVDPSTVGQYSGLKDKNGKRIFEGDIIKFCNWSRKEFTRPVVWDTEHGRFACFIEGALSVGVNPILGTCEVIGNIYDNPDSRKEGEGTE